MNDRTAKGGSQKAERQRSELQSCSGQKSEVRGRGGAVRAFWLLPL
jgi:hypothetical protein